MSISSFARQNQMRFLSINTHSKDLLPSKLYATPTARDGVPDKRDEHTPNSRQLLTIGQSNICNGNEHISNYTLEILPMHNVQFVNYILPRNRTRSDLSYNLSFGIPLNVYLSQLVRVCGKCIFSHICNF